MTGRNEITGIILAGGQGKRLGEEKGLCFFNNKPLIEYAVDVLQPLCGTLLISANNRLDAYKRYGVPVIPDDQPGAGPLGGIMTCLRRTTTRHNLVLSCDMPFVDTNILKTLLEQIENYQIVVPSHETFLVEPLCGYYATNVLSHVEAAVNRGDLKMMNLLKQVRYKSVPIENSEGFHYGITFLNINRREDLLKAEEIVNQMHHG